MASLHVPSLKVKDFSTPSLLLIDGHHSLERVAVDWIALFTTVLSYHMYRRIRTRRLNVGLFRPVEYATHPYCDTAENVWILEFNQSSATFSYVH